MSDDQAKKLFEAIRNIKDQIAGLADAVKTISSNGELVVQGYHQHGAHIAHLTEAIDGLRLKCPMLTPPTDEFLAVCGDE